MMIETLLNINCASLVVVLLLWLCTVSLALWMIDRLFPRIQHCSDDPAPADVRPGQD